MVAEKIPKPKAILCVSAHWLSEGGSATTAMESPKTIHDFYGFPKELYEINFNAKGSPALAKQVKNLVKSVEVELDYSWGFDHGTWIVLRQMYPQASIPVVQLSVDMALPLQTQYNIGRELAPLRKEGVLIIGSGNLVHNLYEINTAPNAKPFPWAVEFDEFVETSLENRDDEALINYEERKPKIARLAHPTDDHYRPLLYALGAAGEKEKPGFFSEGIFAASASMRSIAFGLKEKIMPQKAGRETAPQKPGIPWMKYAHMNNKKARAGAQTGVKKWNE